MEFKKFHIEGLFGLYNHTIDFSKAKKSNENASIIMIYGKNGIGKTTILRMIEGLMKLDFSVFREIYFIKAVLHFSSMKSISVERIKDEYNIFDHLLIIYDGYTAKLNTEHPGAKDVSDQFDVDTLRAKFREDLHSFNFDYIDTERLMKGSIKNEIYNKNILLHAQIQGKLLEEYQSPNESYLAEKVKKFILNSQVWNSKYFVNDEPDLFAKIITNIEKPVKINITDLECRIKNIRKKEKDYHLERIGIPIEKWDSKKLIFILDKEKLKKKTTSQKLVIINSYLEVLETRYSEKISLAERLLTFEKSLNDFLLDKHIEVNIQNGFLVINTHGDIIPETKLSTGEYHLLYLTVLALCTQVMGSVIAIDEPEMSMHISWQNMLINALLMISSKANPQFIFATHSPDIAANYRNSLETEIYG